MRWMMIGLVMVSLQFGCGSSTAPPIEGGAKLARNPATLASEKGATEATAAIADGKLLLKEYPPLPSSAEYGEYITLLKTKGVNYMVMTLPKDGNEEYFIREVRAWNAVMETEIRRQHGPNILEELRDQAETIWKEKSKKK